MLTWQLHCGDALEVLKTLQDQSVNCVVTSPPYLGLRDYQVEGQIGMEATPQDYTDALVAVFSECRRVLTDDGTAWCNLGDGYASNPASGGQGQQDGGEHQRTPKRVYRRPNGLKPKDLIGIPWSVAFALRNDGWYLRSDIIWSKRSCMPESVKDRPTKSHEYVFLLSKSPKYFYNADAIREKYAESTLEQIEAGYDGEGQKDYASAGVQNPSDVKRRIVDGSKSKALANDRQSAQRRLRENSYKAQDDGGEHDHPFGLGANARSVWSLSGERSNVEHFAVMPKTLARRCILAGCPFGGTVLDPFMGSGTTLVVAIEEGRNALGIELNPGYLEIARKRLEATAPLLAREISGHQPQPQASGDPRTQAGAPSSAGHDSEGRDSLFDRSECLGPDGGPRIPVGPGHE